MRRPLLCALAALALVLCLAAPSAAQGKLQIHHIDVGQGDATLIIGPRGTTILIDAGDDGLGDSEVVPYLLARGINTIDYLIATHMDADHIGGIDEVLASGIIVKHALDGGSIPENEEKGEYVDYVAAIEAAFGSRKTIAVGQKIRLGGGAKAVCVYRNGKMIGGDIDVSNENDKSVCLLVTWGDFSYFVGGDVGGGGSSQKDVESAIAPLIGDVDVLRVNHHGSTSSTNETFVGTLKPEAAIISVGENSYGHPRDTVLQNLRSAGADVIQTGADEDQAPAKVMGDIVVLVKKGKKYWINGSRRFQDEFIKKGNQAPAADFTYSDKGNKTFEFNASCCIDDGKIKHYYWNFGDGSCESGGKCCKTSHTFASEGEHTIFLSVLDRFGVAGFISKKVKSGDGKLKVQAQADPANPKRYSNVTICVSVTNGSGQPVSGAAITTVAHYKTTDTTKYGTTATDGKCNIVYYISGATAGYRVYVNVTARLGGESATATTSFVPY